MIVEADVGPGRGLRLFVHAGRDEPHGRTETHVTLVAPHPGIQPDRRDRPAEAEQGHDRRDRVHRASRAVPIDLVQQQRAFAQQLGRKSGRHLERAAGARELIGPYQDPCRIGTIDQAINAALGSRRKRAHLDHFTRQDDLAPPEILGRGGLEYAATRTGLSEIRNQIILEVTERGIPDNLGVATLELASKSGIRVALDDVTLSGTHLAVLSRLALDMIKTDKSLVDQITPECPSPAWLIGLSALLQTTRVPVICEGVETAAQAQALRDAGIPMAQGYYFSRPLPAEELKAYYNARKAPPADTRH